MVYDFQYAYLYQRLEFVLPLEGLYVPLAILTVIVGVLNYYKRKFEKSLLKPAFYAVLFLLASCRAMFVLYVYETHKNVDPNTMLYDLPSLLLMVVCSIIIAQVDKMFPSNVGMRRRHIALFFCNIIICLASFSYHIFGRSMESSKSLITMSFMESGALLILCFLLLWSFRANWVNHRFLSQYKLAFAFLCCGFCLTVRAAMSISGIYTKDSAESNHLLLAPALIYYGVGECAIGYLSLVIQYLLPSVRHSEESTSITFPLLGSLERSKSRTSELITDYYVVADLDDRNTKPNSGESSKNSRNSQTLARKSIEIKNSSAEPAQDASAAHEVQVQKFLTLFEKSLNSTNVVLHEMLGKGGSGAIVYRCTLREGPFSGGTFAVKVMKDCVPADLNALMNEVRIYQSIRHNHIVKFMGADLSSPRREVRLFMEYIPHTLDNYIKKRTNFHLQYFTPMQIAKYMLQIVSGLQVLHDRNIIHRDLKTSNLFVVLGSHGDIVDLKIGDFDVSTFLRLDRPGGGYHTANKGTDGFRAPEMVSRTLDKIKYDIKVDIWSLGMVLYNFLTLQEPYENENRFERGWDTPPTLTPDARANAKYAKLIHIFEQCASPSPTDRPTCSELASLLQTAIASSV